MAEAAVCVAPAEIPVMAEAAEDTTMPLRFGGVPVEMVHLSSLEGSVEKSPVCTYNGDSIICLTTFVSLQNNCVTMLYRGDEQRKYHIEFYIGARVFLCWQQQGKRTRDDDMFDDECISSVQNTYTTDDSIFLELHIDDMERVTENLKHIRGLSYLRSETYDLSEAKYCALPWYNPAIYAAADAEAGSPFHVYSTENCTPLEGDELKLTIRPHVSLLTLSDDHTVTCTTPVSKGLKICGGESSWVIIRKSSLQKKYSGLLRNPEKKVTHALPAGRTAVPTVQFKNTQRGLDTFEFGFAFQVETEEIDRLFRGKNELPILCKSPPKKTLDTLRIAESFTPKQVVCKGNKLVWKTSDTILSIKMLDNESCTGVVNISSFANLKVKLTSKPYISDNGDIWVGTTGENETHRIFLISFTRIASEGAFQIGTEEYVEVKPRGTVDEQILYFTEDQNSVMPIFALDRFDIFELKNRFNNEMVFIGRRKLKDFGTLELFRSAKDSVEQIKWARHNMVYAFDTHAFGVGCFRLHDDNRIYQEYTEHKKCALYSFVFDEDSERKTQTRFNYIPTAMAIAREFLWIAGENAGEIRVYGCFKSPKEDNMRCVELNVQESVVELIRTDTGVIALTLKHAFIVHINNARDNTSVDISKVSFDVQKLNYVHGIQQLGLYLSSFDFVGSTELCKPTKTHPLAKPFIPIDFYEGERKKICPTDKSILKDEKGEIYSVDMGGEYDVLINPNIVEYVMVQHLADFLLVPKHSITLGKSNEPFVLSCSDVSNKMMIKMGKANDPYGCLRVPEIYSTVVNLCEKHGYKGFTYSGSLMNQVATLSIDKHGYYASGMVCTVGRCRLDDALNGCHLYYAYGSEFWER